MVDAVSNLLNRRGREVGARLSRGVRACGRLEACHDGPPCPVLIPQCASPGVVVMSQIGPWKAREAPC